MQEKEQKENRLWKALAYLSGPFLRLPKPRQLPEPEIDRQLAQTLKHQKEMWLLAQKLGLKILPHDHPLKTAATAMGKKAGIHVHSVFLDATAPCFYNATIRNDGKGNAAIAFHGNPLLEKDGDALCRAVTGHEIAHAVLDKNRPTRQAFEIATHDMAFFYWFAGISVALTIPFSPIALSVAAGTLCLAATFVPAALRQAYRRNNEYMADIKGVEICGSAMEAVQDLQYLKRININKKSVHPDLRRSTAKHLMEIFIGSTHPPMSDRIGTLQKVFNLESLPEEKPVVETPITQEERFRMSIECEQLYWL